MTRDIREVLDEALAALRVAPRDFSVEHPEDVSHGDYATNIAFTHSQTAGASPRALAEKIVAILKLPAGVEKADIAGAGFINFHLSRAFFVEKLRGMVSLGETFGKTDAHTGKKVMVEYTDPNPFKEFHIGHLMNNTLGEAISRLIEAEGAEVKRACYQGDVGLHVAKAIFGMMKIGAPPAAGGAEGLAYLGRAYALGAQEYERDERAKKQIVALNRKIFERSDPKVNTLYEWGKRVSLESFEYIYKRLGTKFDFYFFESETGELGKKIVAENMEKVFEHSEGAVVFPGEKHNLHTRVFVTREGLPTYEAKELGLAKIKYEKYPYDLSIVVTGNEVNEYFHVLLRAMTLVFPEFAKRTKHLSHGMLRLPSGKMSSRKGEVITAETLLGAVEAMVRGKMDDREFMTEELSDIATKVAVAAVKYSILRQHIGGDIVFDFEKSISFEGDSGPYLQYSYVRARSVLKKAEETKVRPSETLPKVGPLGRPEVADVERLLYRFPEVIAHAASEYAPHYLVTYLTKLAGAFNNFYAHEKILGSEEETHRLTLTEAFSIVMQNGLNLLGIPIVEKM